MSKGVVVDTGRVKVTVALINDGRMMKLKKQFWGKAKISDVVSFPIGENDPEDGTYFLGEVIVNLDQARRQTEEYQLSLPEELARLITHGALHLLGLRDKTAREHKQMKQLQERVVNSLEIKAQNSKIKA